MTSKLEDGDEVIIHNATSNMAIDNTVAKNKITGVSLTPTDGVITTDNTNVVWTVKKNDDGTYSFLQGENYLGGITTAPNAQGKTYNNLVPTGATYIKWTLEGPDSEDFNYFAYLGEIESTFGNVYAEYYGGFTLYGNKNPTKAEYGINFYKKNADPEVPTGAPTNLIKDLSKLEDGAKVAIYSPSHKTAASTKPNGDWYLRARNATLDTEEGKLKSYTTDIIWTVKKNENGTYSFISHDNPDNRIAIWKSGDYAELTVNPNYNDDTKSEWTVTPASTRNCFYINSPDISHETKGPGYIEAYVRNGTEVFSGYFTKPRANLESELALQFYLVDPEEAIDSSYDDGKWDGVLNPGDEYVIYNDNAKSALGLAKEATFSLTAVETKINSGLAEPGNGAYVFKVGSMGRYYSFEVNGRYLSTNEAEELFFIDPKEDGSVPETAKWYLQKKSGNSAAMGGNVEGYLLYNKEAYYGGTPVCIEYFSSVFSGWTFSTKNDLSIYLFNFYKVAEDTEIRNGIVQDPSAAFDCEDYRYIEQDFDVAITLDDLAEEIRNVKISYTVGSETKEVTEFEGKDNLNAKNYTFTIPASEIDIENGLTSFELKIEVENGYDISYVDTKSIRIIDEPFFTNLTPKPNAQTGDDKRPVISAKVGNVGDNPTFTLTVKGEEITDYTFENGILSYTPSEDMKDGRTPVAMTVTRADGVSAEKSWSFTVGVADYQLYFGQLHSHTTYSDGSGTLESAFDYVEAIPESSKVQFVAFTDHSNYFDTTSAANPADALNDASLMTPASKAKWDEYRNKIAAFNERQYNVVAVPGFEMTWSGGPGHINTFDSEGIVSRNNNALNEKTGDAGMKLYYETLKKGDSISQLNHPGATFGTFADFSYWDEEIDKKVFLVEVGNGEGQIGQGGYYPSYEYYTMALDKGWHVAPTNNQDNHKGRWGNANDARDVILTKDFSQQGIYDAIRELKVYATEDKNLEVTYKLNGQPMGTIFSDDETPEKLNIEVTVYDPNSSDKISKVEVVTSGGKVAHTWSDKTELAEGQLLVELDPEYSYYYIRVTQEDNDKAVTSPIWVGKNVSVGIDNFKSNKEISLLNKETTLTTTLYNNEEVEATVKSLVYTVDGSKVIGTDTESHTIPAGGTADVTFAYTPTEAKRMTVTVTAIIEINGKEYTYTKDLTLTCREQENLPVSPIADVQAEKEENHEFVIEGYVTSNASGYDKDTAFFDCIFVQDDTAGIVVFPVSGNFKIGDHVRVEGYTEYYQGEPELQVTKINIIDEETKVYEPKEVTAAEINDQSVLGSLVKISGTVESYEMANGLVQTIMVKDANGDVARVFIDGYITALNEVENIEGSEGLPIEVVGLASYDNTFNAPEGPFPRIRIRDRKDVTITVKTEVDINDAEVSGLKDTKYTGKAITQKPTVTLNGETLVEGEDYEVSYKNNKNVGTATVTITGKGKYVGTKTVTFKINADTKIKLDKTSASVGTVNVGKYKNTLQLKATVTGHNNTKVTWTSSNPKVAKVDANGKVTGVSDPSHLVSTVTITAKTVDGKTATCKVTVEDPINAFVRRLYKHCLNRNPDASGFKYWTNALRTKRITAADAVKGFFDSTEMKNKKLSNSEIIERCYLSMLDRKSDAGGKKYWEGIFKSKGKNAVLKGFVDSNEFAKICKEFGIVKGTIK